jgi:hypothetical protein
MDFGSESMVEREVYVSQLLSRANPRGRSERGRGKGLEIWASTKDSLAHVR